MEDILIELEETESILPDSFKIRAGIAEAFTSLNKLDFIPKLEVKRNNEKWRIHRSDPDNFPSDPHAHNVENGLKLHLGTGGLYNKREFVDFINEKHLDFIRSKIFEDIEKWGKLLPQLDYGMHV